MTLSGKHILLIVAGGIAAYKSLDLIRQLRAQGADVTPVLTRAGAQFVTPLSLSALAGRKVYSDLFDLTDEAEMGHIQLSRSADLIVVAPATANIMAQMAQGAASDLASTLLLATDTPVMMAPAMNVRMWDHPATQRNLHQLLADGVLCVGPNSGDMACGEYGPGRMAEPAEILVAIAAHFGPKPLLGRRVLVTSGPTREAIDPVRYISNHSSGAQGAAVAAALRDLGAVVEFVTGPADVPPPHGAVVHKVQSAQDMHDQVMALLPVDAAVFTAAVADWRVKSAAAQKMKKTGKELPVLEFTENPDILAAVSQLPARQRPRLVVGFAAETENLIDHARAKLRKKGCDWICANDVSPQSGTFGGSDSQIHLVTAQDVETWPHQSKQAAARMLAARMAATLGDR